MSTLYRVLKDHVPKSVIDHNNSRKLWEYGYNEKHDMVVISKDGTIGEIYEIQNLLIALPKTPTEIDYEHNNWVKPNIPADLLKIRKISEWNRRDTNFKLKYHGFIEEQFERRENGYWFINNNVPTYVTGSHYMYLTWSKIDVGSASFRESNRIFWLFWEACKADHRSFGMCYLKNRRSGFSFMGASEASNLGTTYRDSKIGICSKTAKDAKSLFTDKLVPIVRNYPFFFKPIQDGSDNPKTELSFRVPATRLTRKSMDSEMEDEIDGLDTTIDHRATSDNAYDGEKLLMLIEDESGKIEAPNNILVGWRIRKTCLRLGSRIIGKCMMGSTVNELSKGGQQFKELYYDSDVTQRNSNGQTKSGLYSLFIPMEHNYEGYIDIYGHGIVEDPVKPIKNAEGYTVSTGVVTYWNNEAEALKADPKALNEHYRQFPRTESHAFRDEAVSSTFNLTNIYAQIEYNDGLLKHGKITQGSFSWKDGIPDIEVIFTPDKRGRFYLSWIPPLELRNKVIKKDGLKYPMNDALGAFGCDPYDISATVDGRGSAGSLHGLTMLNVNNAPSNMFFLEYIARPETAEIFFEEMIMACHFYGMPILIESNKTRLLYYFKNRGYRKFSINRPDKDANSLSKTERELGGVPSNGEDFINTHATAIETYIQKYVGYDITGVYRDPEEIGNMYFTRTLEDWSKFKPTDRTKRDASISSGLAIIATNRHTFNVKKEVKTVSIPIMRYDNTGTVSKLVRN